MSAHTPGPWQVAGSFPNMAFVVSTGKDADCVCKCDTGDSESLPHKANASLIAAAPELLEALVGLLDHYTQLVNSGDAGNWDPEKEAQVIAARAALAKVSL